jgi:hypothetical protein
VCPCYRCTPCSAWYHSTRSIRQDAALQTMAPSSDVRYAYSTAASIMRPTCPVQHILLHLTILIMSGEGNKLRSSSVRFQVLTAASMKMVVFWVVAPCSLVMNRPDVGGSKHLWNVGKLLPDYRAQQPRRQLYLWNSSLWSFLQAPVNSSVLGPIFLSTSSSNTLNPFSSFNVKDQVSHPYTAKRKIILL